ncbi:hypothetical protein N806_24400 [Rhodococcus sp. P27]|nr:hypothetical protein N806_24400 [Rhodococcus sp. P27]
MVAIVRVGANLDHDLSYRVLVINRERAATEATHREPSC